MFSTYENFSLIKPKSFLHLPLPKTQHIKLNMDASVYTSQRFTEIDDIKRSVPERPMELVILLHLLVNVLVFMCGLGSASRNVND